nr:hypothetical protein [Candidatus Njordarchaeum guaymaensis]
MSEECKKFIAEAEAEAKTGDQTIAAERWRSAGFCYSDIGDFAKASECFRNSAEESLKGKNKTGASDSLLCAVIVSLRSGNREEASNVVKIAESKGLSGTDNMKFAANLLKAVSSGDKNAKQKVCDQFSFLIEDNYWLRKTLEKMGVSTSFA